METSFCWMGFGGDCDGVVLGERIELGRFKLLRFGTVLRDEWWEEPDVGRFIYRAGPWSARGQCHCRCGGGWRRTDYYYYYYYCSFRPRRRPLSRDRSSHRARIVLGSDAVPQYRDSDSCSLVFLLTARRRRRRRQGRPPDSAYALPPSRNPIRFCVPSRVARAFRETVFRSIASEQSPRCCSRRAVTAEHHARLPVGT